MINRPNKPSRALSWDGSWGVCFRRDLHFTLYRPPVIPGLAVEQIDYAPEVRSRMVLETGASWRPMTDAETAAVDGVLDRMVEAAELAVCGPP